jgi:membrane AbrB-like protein
MVPAPMFRLAQAVIGLLIARTLAADTLAELLRDWPLFLAGVVSVIAASSLIGWALARWRVLPGSTAVWGAAPGGATAMIVMSGNFGADTRLVAFMQYLRVVTVVIVATLVARVWTGGSAVSHPSVVLFPPVDPGALLATLALAAGGAQLGQVLRLPAGAMLVPMVLGAILNTTGVINIELPPWLLAPTYAVIGWQVGSRFERSILLHALRALPALLLATAALIGACAGFAALLVLVADVPPLTAYLATSPGGIDSVAIIGMAGQADMQFVMAMQTARFMVVMVTGPWIASRVAGRIARRAAHPERSPGTASGARGP